MAGSRQQSGRRSAQPNPLTRFVQRSARQARTGLRLALPGFNRDFLIQAVKVTASAGIAWMLATLILPRATPIYAPITALLVAVATLRASFQDAAQRVLAVVVGIGLSYFFGAAFGLQVWTIVLVTGLGLLIGQLLRLPRGVATQVPISGLLIMAIGATPGHAGERIIETMIGAVVSIVINMVIAPPNHVVAGAAAVTDLVERLVQSLADMTSGISRTWAREEAADWLQEARANGPIADAASNAVEAGADSLRLRPGSAQHTHDQERVDTAMDTMRVVEVQVRVIARSLRDTADALADRDGTLPPIPLGTDLLATTAEALSAFGSAFLETDPADREIARRQAAQILDSAKATAAAMNRDVADLTAANITRGLHLGALVLETGRVLEELRAGLDRPTTTPSDQS